MSSVIWYLYDFARKAWVKGFADAKSAQSSFEKPDRFRDFPEVYKEYCISCGACTSACPSPNAIKLVSGYNESDVDDCANLIESELNNNLATGSNGETDTVDEIKPYPVINKSACIRCGFCAEVCPTDPKTLTCGENHFIREEFTILPHKRKYVIDDFLCIKCKKCLKECPVDGAIELDANKVHVNQNLCIACGKCFDVCPVKGALKSIYIDYLEEQKKVIRITVDTLEDFITSKEEDLRDLSDRKIMQLELPFYEVWDKVSNILDDKELILEIIDNAISRLKLRIILWDTDKCNKCRLCVDECPTNAIDYNKDKNEVIRNEDKCLRCSTCYQTCPFGVVSYFLAKFIIIDSDNSNSNNNSNNNQNTGIQNGKIEDKIIKITVNASQLANSIK